MSAPVDPTLVPKPKLPPPSTSYLEHQRAVVARKRWLQTVRGSQNQPPNNCGALVGKMTAAQRERVAPPAPEPAAPVEPEQPRKTIYEIVVPPNVVPGKTKLQATTPTGQKIKFTVPAEATIGSVLTFEL